MLERLQPLRRMDWSGDVEIGQTQQQLQIADAVDGVLHSLEDHSMISFMLLESFIASWRTPSLHCSRWSSPLPPYQLHHSNSKPLSLAPAPSSKLGAPTWLHNPPSLQLHTHGAPHPNGGLQWSPSIYGATRQHRACNASSAVKGSCPTRASLVCGNATACWPCTASTTGHLKF